MKGRSIDRPNIDGANQSEDVNAGFNEGPIN